MLKTPIKTSLLHRRIWSLCRYGKGRIKTDKTMRSVTRLSNAGNGEGEDLVPTVASGDDLIPVHGTGSADQAPGRDGGHHREGDEDDGAPDHPEDDGNGKDIGVEQEEGRMSLRNQESTPRRIGVRS